MVTRELNRLLFSRCQMNQQVIATDLPMLSKVSNLLDVHEVSIYTLYAHLPLDFYVTVRPN